MYYSQFGQDEYLYEKYFKYNSFPGVFVDIGAHDGVSGSNTKFFEDLGWSGVCYEPIPEVFKKLRANRICDCEMIAISNQVGWMPFRIVKGYSEMLSGLVECQDRNHLERINREVHEHNQEVDVIEVETSTFGREISAHDIDYLSIDVEGAESSIIRSIAFKNYNIKFMSVEFNNNDVSLHEYIESQGYKFDISLGVDRIFKKI